jgi:hypothetical protein
MATPQRPTTLHSFDLDSGPKVVRGRLVGCDLEILTSEDTSIEDLLLLRVWPINNCTRLSKVVYDFSH